MKYLGVDVGTKKVGIAVSDDGGSIAFPSEVCARKDAVARIQTLVEEKGIGCVVIGDSLNLAGQENAVAEDIREIASALQDTVTIAFEPEQFSTQASRRLGEGRDDQAAAIILQSHLDKLKRE